IIGDTHQSIYGWRGAIDALSFTDYPKFYLTESYRFHSGIAELANKILARKVAQFSLGEIPELVGLAEKRSDTSGTRAYLGRSNLSVISDAIELVESGRTKGFAYEGSINNAIYTQDGVSIYDIYGLFSDQRKYIRNEFIQSFTHW